ncbi:AbiH family protein [Lactococcus lactis]|uniref:AbiH family protein n=1 Tax=Lactococcus lactis TaxID=1358 RepID=UPI003D9A3599
MAIKFNYTDTLESLYGITDILHIHGSVSEIDWTYFKELLANYPNKNYIFTYYDESDRQNALSMIDIILG